MLVRSYFNSAYPLRGYKVLVVDDNIDSLDLITFLLDDYGADVYPAKSAIEALETLKRIQPDILISDIRMPDEDGYSLIRKLREFEAAQKQKSVPAIAISSSIKEEITTSLESGFQRHIYKPIDLDELVSAVAELTGRL